MLVGESKEKVDEEWKEDTSKTDEKNMKEVKNVMEKLMNDMFGIKKSDGMPVQKKSKKKMEVWKNNFESLDEFGKRGKE